MHTNCIKQVTLAQEIGSHNALNATLSQDNSNARSVGLSLSQFLCCLTMPGLSKDIGVIHDSYTHINS